MGYMMMITKHAKRRAAQRSIPERVIEWIYIYGDSYASRGCMGYRLDRHSLALAADDLPASDIERLRRYFGTYIIASGEKIITAAYAKSRRFQ